MNILLLCDDYYHPAKVVIDGLNYLNEKHTIHVIEDMREFSIDTLNHYELVILSKSNNISSKDRSNWMTPELEQGFLNYVSNGGSLFAIHSGTAGYGENKVFRKLLGGVFTHHPEQCKVLVESTKEHQITKGVLPFEVFDEHYFMDVDSDIEIIMQTTSDAGVQPAAWFRNVGEGKVFVFTPGHNLAVWLDEQFKKVILNSIDLVINI